MWNGNPVHRISTTLEPRHPQNVASSDEIKRKFQPIPPQTGRSAPNLAIKCSEFDNSKDLLPININDYNDEGKEMASYEFELIKALREFFDSDECETTLEDIEDLIEIHRFQEIEKKIQSVLEDKRERMRRRYDRRLTNGIDSKLNLYELVIERIAKDQQEQVQSHRELVAMFKALQVQKEAA